MIVGNKELRNKAIPFEALAFAWFGTNIGLGRFLVDFRQHNGTAFTRPYAGDVVEARLTMALTAPPAEAFDLYLGIGNLDGDLNITESYPLGEIIKRHRMLTGTETPLHCNAGATLFIDALSLLPGIPGKDSPDYNPDGFVVLFTFANAPVDVDGFSLGKFQLLCSAQMGLAT